MAANIANSTMNTTGAAGVAIDFPSNPFVGLRPFNSDEALLFFGRDEQTVELLRRLHRDHFIAVVGSSGCGKSSLVRAGLIPKLRAGFLTEDRDQWLVAVMKPGDSPLQNLAAALTEATHATNHVDACADAIRAEGTQAVIERLSPALADSDANLLLLVDQFEEIFRFGVESGKPERRAEADDFISIMLALAEQRRLPAYVVMTMRSDFLGDCDNFHGLPEAMNRSQYLVPRLTRRQRRQAIEGPINLFGGSVSPRLLDRALNDVGDKSDQLPVMQHAMMRTWEQASESGDPQVDLPHYEAAGGIKNALSKDAEAALDGMDADELKIVERMFQALTDTDARNRRVRRPAHLSEIEAVTGANRETVLKIIERFRGGGRSFLTMTDDDDPLIDISHESLIRQWERMSEWVKSEVESRDLYLRLVDSAKKGRELWRGSDLAEILRWREQKQPDPAWARRYDKDGMDDDDKDEATATFGLAFDFLERSKLQEELEAGRRERERKNKLRRAWAVAMILAIAFLLASLSAFYARKQTAIANEQKKIAVEAQFDLFTLLVKSVASRGMSLYYTCAPRLGLWFNSDGTPEPLRKLTDDETQMLSSLKILNESIATLQQAPQNTAPQRSDILRLQENALDFRRCWERASKSGDLKSQFLEEEVTALLADIQKLIDICLRFNPA
jgi:energy-coupling factor transporter ATP-binding protein EcfA2